MTKRRDFIKKSVIGLTTGIAIGGMGLSTKSSASVFSSDVLPPKDWHVDPEWSKVKYSDWGGRESQPNLAQWMGFW